MTDTTDLHAIDIYEIYHCDFHIFDRFSLYPILNDSDSDLCSRATDPADPGDTLQLIAFDTLTEAKAFCAALAKTIEHEIREYSADLACVLLTLSAGPHGVTYADRRKPRASASRPTRPFQALADIERLLEALLDNDEHPVPSKIGADLEHIAALARTARNALPDPEFTPAETAAILAGLRLYEIAAQRADFPPGLEDIATDGGAFAPLSAAQTDELCERINCGALDPPAPDPAARDPSDPLRELVLEMGCIIRRLDEEHEYLEFWTHDGGYILDSRFSRNEATDASTDPADQAYRDAARRLHHRGGDIEIDDNAVVSRGDDPGAYVQAWIWIDKASTHPLEEARPH